MAGFLIVLFGTKGGLNSLLMVRTKNFYWLVKVLFIFCCFTHGVHVCIYIYMYTHYICCLLVIVLL